MRVFWLAILHTILISASGGGRPSQDEDFEVAVLGGKRFKDPRKPQRCYFRKGQKALRPMHKLDRNLFVISSKRKKKSRSSSSPIYGSWQVWLKYDPEESPPWSWTPYVATEVKAPPRDMWIAVTFRSVPVTTIELNNVGRAQFLQGETPDLEIHSARAPMFELQRTRSKRFFVPSSPRKDTFGGDRRNMESGHRDVR